MRKISNGFTLIELLLTMGIIGIVFNCYVNMTITLINPIACEQGLRFAIREGGRTVGSGVVSTIIE